MRKLHGVVLLITAAAALSGCDEIKSFKGSKPVMVTFQADKTNSGPTGTIVWSGAEVTDQLHDTHPLPVSILPGESSKPVDIGPYLDLRGPKGDKCQIAFKSIVAKVVTDPKTKKVTTGFDIYLFKSDVCKNAVVTLSQDKAHLKPLAKEAKAS